MLTEAVRNTQPSAENGSKRPPKAVAGVSYIGQINQAIQQGYKAIVLSAASAP